MSNISAQMSVCDALLHVYVCSKAMLSQLQVVRLIMPLSLVVTLSPKMRRLQAATLLPLAAALTRNLPARLLRKMAAAKSLP